MYVRMHVLISCGYSIDISCSGLITRMFGPPNSYVKVCVTKLGSNFAAPESTEHYRTAPCTTTANPIWKEEVGVVSTVVV